MSTHDFCCKNCGAAMENVKFCEYCGMRFQVGEAPSHLPDPDAKTTVFVVEDVFKIRGQGNVMTGKVANQPITVGEVFPLVDSGGNLIENITIKKIEMFGKTNVTTAEPDEIVGFLIDSEAKLKRGMMLQK